MDDLVYSGLVEMAAMIRAGKISPVELIDTHLARIEKLEPRLNAFVKVDFDRARQQAKAAEAYDAAPGARDSLGPLHGVPVTLKSSIDVAGLPSECGTRLRQGYVSQSDATLVSRLRSAGAIILGNTNVPEFMMAYETDNLLYGRTNNPWDTDCTPGGSSGGEAAAIAAAARPVVSAAMAAGPCAFPRTLWASAGSSPLPAASPPRDNFPPQRAHSYKSELSAPWRALSPT